METYYFDRIRINSYQYPKTVADKLPVDELKKHCRRFEIREAYKPWLNGYQSKVDVVAPFPEFLKILKGHQHILEPCKITYIEIAKDIPFPTEWAASKAVIDFSYHQKWATFTKTFVNDIYYSASQYCGDVGKISGSKKFKNCIYARYSKITGEPVSHREWRISGSQLIKDRTEISSINDLLEFDFPSFFEKTDSKYLLPVERISQKKLGLYLTGMGYRKQLSDRQKWHVGCIGQAYSQGGYAETVRYLQTVQRALQNRPGPKTGIDGQIAGIKNFGRFRDPLYINAQPYNTAIPTT